MKVLGLDTDVRLYFKSSSTILSSTVFIVRSSNRNDATIEEQERQLRTYDDDDDDNDDDEDEDGSNRGRSQSLIDSTTLLSDSVFGGEGHAAVLSSPTASL